MGKRYRVNLAKKRKYRTHQNPNKTKKLSANPRTSGGCV
tara:strand:- start:446 stop:562 length:117 start_codon:yes stop_codon:yes gene_type:complete